eukprot:scaffold268456_cov43-Tisochrysis_lutea.AAC.1
MGRLRRSRSYAASMSGPAAQDPSFLSTKNRLKILATPTLLLVTPGNGGPNDQRPIPLTRVGVDVLAHAIACRLSPICDWAGQRTLGFG